MKLTALRHKQQEIADAALQTVQDHGVQIEEQLLGPGKPREKLVAIYHAGFAGSSTQGRDEMVSS